MDLLQVNISDLCRPLKKRQRKIRISRAVTRYHAEIILGRPRLLNLYPQPARNAYAGGGIIEALRS
jgi:hypothetical protein